MKHLFSKAAVITVLLGLTPSTTMAKCLRGDVPFQFSVPATTAPFPSGTLRACYRPGWPFVELQIGEESIGVLPICFSIVTSLGPHEKSSFVFGVGTAVPPSLLGFRWELAPGTIDVLIQTSGKCSSLRPLLPPPPMLVANNKVMTAASKPGQAQTLEELERRIEVLERLVGLRH